MFLVAANLLDITAVAVEQRIFVLVPLVGFRPIHSVQIRRLGRERLRDGMPYRIEPLGNRAIFIGQRFCLAPPAPVEILVLLPQCFYFVAVRFDRVVLNFTKLGLKLLSRFGCPVSKIVVVVAQDFPFKNSAEFAGVQSLKGVKLCRAFAEPLLERAASPFALFDRRARQPVPDALLVRQRDGPQLDVEVKATLAQNELDLARGGDRPGGLVP
jgi:hypothetical protein